MPTHEIEGPYSIRIREGRNGDVSVVFFTSVQEYSFTSHASLNRLINQLKVAAIHSWGADEAQAALAAIEARPHNLDDHLDEVSGIPTDPDIEPVDPATLPACEGGTNLTPSIYDTNRKVDEILKLLKEEI